MVEQGRKTMATAQCRKTKFVEGPLRKTQALPTMQLLKTAKVLHSFHALYGYS